jgi:thiol-disulfide isomerase/thioredoxin
MEFRLIKTFVVTALIIFGSIFAHAQNELAPILEKEFDYKNWTFKKASGDGEIELRKFVAGKKLVLVVYFAPWCHNWRYEAPIVQRLYEKYKDKGFDVIGIGEYDTVQATKNDVLAKKLTFPVVYESDSTGSRLNTTHYGYRSKLGDTRKWGSPFNVFVLSGNVLNDGDALAKKLHISAGELIETEAEAFIREKLGLSAEEKQAQSSSKKSDEICDPNAVTIKKP